MAINPGSARRVGIPAPSPRPTGGTTKPTMMGGNTQHNPSINAGRMNGGGHPLGGNTQPHNVNAGDGGYVPGHSSNGGMGRQPERYES